MVFRGFSMLSAPFRRLSAASRGSRLAANEGRDHRVGPGGGRLLGAGVPQVDRRGGAWLYAPESGAVGLNAGPRGAPAAGLEEVRVGQKWPEMA